MRSELVDALRAPALSGNDSRDPREWTDEYATEYAHAVAADRGLLLSPDLAAKFIADLRATGAHRGLPSEHPEARCQRCGRPNIVWFVASALWNAVMRPEGGDRWGIVCPVCFVELAEESGVTPTGWQLVPEEPA